MKNKTSMYNPVWEHIRKYGTCKLLAPTDIHARIIKAVTKRKLLDKSPTKPDGQLHHRSNGEELTFQLRIGRRDLGIIVVEGNPAFDFREEK